MDFKVAGTAEAVTALQLDTKIDGLPADVLAQALNQARDARLKVLDVMLAAMPAPRTRSPRAHRRSSASRSRSTRSARSSAQRARSSTPSSRRPARDVNVDDDGTVGTVTIGAKRPRWSTRPDAASS